MAYDRVRLNSLPSMAGARALYGELGFREIPPYRTPLVSGVLYFELELSNLELPASAEPRRRVE